MNNNYMETIIAAVNNGSGLDEIYDATVRFKTEGLRQADAYRVLKEVRSIFANRDEAKEDLILELMDYVAGFCQVKYYIWDSVLQGLSANADC